MPYIAPHCRAAIDDSIDRLVSKLHSFTEEDRNGIVNYAITRIVAESLEPVKGWRYSALLRAYGTFQAAGAEFYRRLVATYEDSCIARNGDVSAYHEKIEHATATNEA